MTDEAKKHDTARHAPTFKALLGRVDVKALEATRGQLKEAFDGFLAHAGTLGEGHSPADPHVQRLDAARRDLGTALGGLNQALDALGSFADKFAHATALHGEAVAKKAKEEKA